MTKRRRLSKSERFDVFVAHKGVCRLCKRSIQVGEAWDVEHLIPLEMGGVDDSSNFGIAHRKCHRVHTSEVDVPDIAQAKRREAAHVGAKTPSGAFGRKKKEPKPLRVANGESWIARRWEQQ